MLIEVGVEIIAPTELVVEGEEIFVESKCEVVKDNELMQSVVKVTMPSLDAREEKLLAVSVCVNISSRFARPGAFGRG